MAIGKQKTEGGQGGRRGHSNMSHWDYTEEIKTATRKRRRLDSKVIITEELGDIESEGKAMQKLNSPS
jgi:hypothetical protein